MDSIASLLQLQPSAILRNVLQWNQGGHVQQGFGLNQVKFASLQRKIIEKIDYNDVAIVNRKLVQTKKC